VNLAAKLWVCYCVPLCCFLELAAMLLLLCTFGLFGGYGRYVLDLLLCTDGLFCGQGCYVVGLLLCNV
jgi:hypothetical protein